MKGMSLEITEEPIARQTPEAQPRPAYKELVAALPSQQHLGIAESR